MVLIVIIFCSDSLHKEEIARQGNMRSYTRQEVAQNKDKDKVLIILHDNVYNVYPFLNEHPGGEEVLADHKGKDGSEDFDDVGHSKDAMELMKKYFAGTIIEKEKLNKSPKKGWVAGYTKERKELKDSKFSFYLSMAGMVLLVAALYYYIWLPQFCC